MPIGSKRKKTDDDSLINQIKSLLDKTAEATAQSGALGQRRQITDQNEVAYKETLRRRKKQGIIK